MFLKNDPVLQHYRRQLAAVQRRLFDPTTAPDWDFALEYWKNRYGPYIPLAEVIRMSPELRAGGYKKMVTRRGRVAVEKYLAYRIRTYGYPTARAD